MIIRNFYEDKLAQASYLVGCAEAGEAIVLDPLRDIAPYLDMAGSLGLRIVAVTETHIHADYLSGTRELAAATGAKMYLSCEGGEAWKYDYAGDSNVVLLQDGDEIRIGNLAFRALHTPGHTPEHLAFLLTDHRTSSEPHSLFSGDFVFVGDVGRPDLLERAANFVGTMEAGARDVFRSLGKLDSLPDSLLVWPGHGAGSACGKALGGSPVDSLGYQRRSNWAFQVKDEDRFVDEILSGQPEPPLYFKEMKHLNKVGPDVIGRLPQVPRTTEPNGQQVDIRGIGQIRSAPITGTIAIPGGPKFTTWAGWLLHYDQPITLISESQQAADEAARDLATIGLDRVVGWTHPSDLASRMAAPIQEVSCADLDPAALILDVRGANERSACRVRGSLHIPLGHLSSRLTELPQDRDIVVQCATGFRSSIACTVLLGSGFVRISNLQGGIEAVKRERPDLLCSD